jgi:alpha-beta hydrolase superfamily lysophospholipase
MPQDPSQPGSAEEEGRFSGAGGTSLFYRRQHPSSARGLVVVAHGLTEHSGRYGALRDALATAGLAFCALDHRGHGRSSGNRGDVARFDDYVDDLGAFCEHMRRQEPRIPLFVIGHSMGGLIAARYASRRPPGLDGVVLSSTPAVLGSGIANRPTFLARILSYIRPRWMVDPGIDPVWVSHDPEVIEALQDDPLILREVTVRLVRELMRAIRKLPRHARAICAPALTLHGTEDPLADLRGAERLQGWLGSTDKAPLVFEGLLHELFNEMREDREKVLGALVRWLTARLDTENGE